MVKILSIGNSFSQDAHKWLGPICESAGESVYNVNLYIPSCSLEMHWNNFKSENVAYDYEVGGVCCKKISLPEALRAEEWDAITFQQVSDFSGKSQSYIPYLTWLADEVRKICPKAQFYMHQTWAYEQNSDYPPFANYHNNQKEMFVEIIDANVKACKEIGGGIIPTGEVIQYLREHDFKYCLSRDGFHLSLLYGRYAAALTWYAVLFGKDIRQVSFLPQLEEEAAEEGALEVIKRAVTIVMKGQEAL